MKVLSEEEIELIYSLIKRKNPNFESSCWFYFPLPLPNKEYATPIYCFLCENTFEYDRTDLNLSGGISIPIIKHARQHLKESNLLAFL